MLTFESFCKWLKRSNYVMKHYRFCIGSPGMIVRPVRPRTWFPQQGVSILINMFTWNDYHFGSGIVSIPISLWMRFIWSHTSLYIDTWFLSRNLRSQKSAYLKSVHRSIKISQWNQSFTFTLIVWNVSLSKIYCFSVST